MDRVEKQEKRAAYRSRSLQSVRALAKQREAAVEGELVKSSY